MHWCYCFSVYSRACCEASGRKKNKTAAQAPCMMTQPSQSVLTKNVLGSDESKSLAVVITFSFAPTDT